MAFYHRATEQQSQPLKPLDDPLSLQASLSSLYSSRGLLEILQSSETEQLLTASDFMRSTLSHHADHAPHKDTAAAPSSPPPFPASRSPSDSPLHLSVSSAQLDTAPTFPNIPAPGVAWPPPAVTLRPHAPVMPPSAAYPARRPPSTQSPINPHYAGLSPHTASSNTSAMHSTFPQSVLSHLHSVEPPQSHGTIQSTFNSAMLSSLVSNVQFEAPGTPTRTAPTSLPPLPTSGRSGGPPSQRASDNPPQFSPRHATDPHQTLAQFVDATRGSRTAMASVAMLAAEAAFALHGMHAHACVHLHLHPHSVQICPPEDGAASPSSAAAAGAGGGFRVRLSSSSTPHGMLLTCPVGAAGFIPPEISATSEEMPTPATPAADVYALAVLTASLLIATLDPASPADVDPSDTAALTQRLQALLNSGALDWNLAYVLENSWVDDPNLRPSAMQVARACAWVAYMHASPHAAATVADSTDEPMTARAEEAGSAADRLSDMLEQSSVSQQQQGAADAATGAPQWLVEYITRRGNTAAAAQAVPRRADVPALAAAAAEARTRTVLGALKRPGWAARAATASQSVSGGTPRGTPSGTPTGTPREGSGPAAALRRRAARSKRLREGAFGAAVLQDILMATLKSADTPEVPAGGSSGSSRRARASAQVSRRSMSRGHSRGRGRGRRDAGETHADRAAIKSAGVNKHRAPRSPSPSCAPSFSLSGAAEIVTASDFMRRALSPGLSSGRRLSRPSTPHSTPRSTRPPSPSPEVSSAVTAPPEPPDGDAASAPSTQHGMARPANPGGSLQRAVAGVDIADALRNRAPRSAPS